MTGSVILQASHIPFNQSVVGLSDLVRWLED